MLDTYAMNAPASKKITEDGLVLSKVDRIEAIRSPSEIRTTIPVYAYMISRMIRRDYYMLTALMYRRVASPVARLQIGELLNELLGQSEMIQGDAAQYALPLPVPQTLELRIVSPHAAALLRALRQADQSFFYLCEAEAGGLITLERRDALLAPFRTAYGDLMSYVLQLKRQSPHTAAEMGCRLGLS